MAFFRVGFCFMLALVAVVSSEELIEVSDAVLLEDMGEVLQRNALKERLVDAMSGASLMQMDQTSDEPVKSGRRRRRTSVDGQPLASGESAEPTCQNGVQGDCA
eukprot:gnl/TRDRNA2_/TRDRNA2_179315_c0_seq1.p1 gnl/TRDRNA2_/TRDRNA2_179315_c0~~gnl/TRDRNA2_/TRDRNA2_179315_c0_seq1.p1  ORF type:complete len:104 (+),score=23.22 gnl/TRDRNA2_/TRDRNA2_179315_c0_seq1:89-400(+)